MNVLSGNKINNLLKEGIPHGIYFSEWIHSYGYSAQLIKQYRKTGWLEMLCRGVFYRAGEDLTAYAALASYRKQIGEDLRLAAHSALELHGVMHFVPMGKPKAMLASDQKKRFIWLSSDRFDREIELFYTPQVAVQNPEAVVREGLQLTSSSSELAILECIYLAPKRYSYMDVYYLMEQLSGLRPDVLQDLLERTKSYRVKRMFLYMAEKANYSWFEDLILDRIDLGTSKLQLCKEGIFVSKYSITVPQELYNYE